METRTETQDHRTIKQLWDELSTGIMIAEKFPPKDAEAFEQHKKQLRSELLKRCDRLRDPLDATTTRM